MDGRRFRRWVVCGGLAAALVGCHKNTYQDAIGPKPGQQVGAIGPTKPSMWGNNPPKPDPTPTMMPMTADTTQAASPGKKKPMSPEAQAALADTLVAAATTDPPPPDRDQRLDRARLTYQAILKKDSKNGPAMLGMARLYARTGDREPAVETYRKYLKLKPNDHAVMSEVAAAHARWKDMDGAVAWYDEALKADPQNRTYRKFKGFCLAKAGRWDEATATLMQVMPEPDVRFCMAQMLADMNQLEYSRQQLMMALQADPNYAPARAFLAALDQDGQPQQPPGANPVMQAGGYAP